MLTEFRLPALGADMDAGTIVEWHVAPGDRCRRGDVVAVVETDKGAIDVETFVDGVVRELRVPPGTRVPVGTVLAVLDTEAPAPASETLPAPPPIPAVEGARAVIQHRAKISPAARKRAQELHVDVASLRGTGPDGAVTLQDVERAGPSSQPSPTVVGAGAEGMRAAIAAAMSRSKREIPHYYLATTVDVTCAVEWLAAHNAAVPVTGRLLLPVLLVKAIALACREQAGFSGFYRDDHYEPAPVVHVGVAVALRGGGLVAPALAHVVAKRLKSLGEAKLL